MRVKLSRMLGGILGIATVAWGAPPTELENWLGQQATESKSRLLRNIGERAGARRGSVIASPSKGEPSEPDYFFYWVRDAALVMSVVDRLGVSSEGDERKRLERLMFDYVDFARENQLTPNRSGDIGGGGLGEPKFHVDGKAFQGDWGRPQNDGPALRALTLIGFANRLLESDRKEFVGRKLYDSKLPTESVIKSDLEYVLHHWKDSSFDPWEEIRGKNLYTLLTQRSALVEGARFATKMDDPGASEAYRNGAKEIDRILARFWNEDRGYLLATIDRDGGIEDKTSQLDVASLLAVLHSPSPDGSFSVEDGRTLSTIVRFDEQFGRIYAINNAKKDREGNRLANAIGRYPEDRYNGLTTDGRGNPWFLATLAMAEHHYRLATHWKRSGRMELTYLHLRFLKTLPALTADIAINETIRKDDPRFGKIFDALIEAGDSYLRRVKFHAGEDGNLTEQFDRENGFRKGARDLTWSHASLLTAAMARDEAVR